MSCESELDLTLTLTPTPTQTQTQTLTLTLTLTGESELDLRGFLDYAKPNSAILLAGSAAGSATLSPRKMQERRLSLVGAAASSAKDMARMLAF